jgi:hypothetical protein
MKNISDIRILMFMQGSICINIDREEVHEL